MNLSIKIRISCSKKLYGLTTSFWWYDIFKDCTFGLPGAWSDVWREYLTNWKSSSYPNPNQVLNHLIDINNITEKSEWDKNIDT